MNIHNLLFFPAALFLALISPAAFAQEAVQSVPEVSYDSALAVNDGYVEPTFENLSKMYWAVGKFDREDDKAIDNYLLINECELYLQYYNSDFDWIKIREATRAHIQEKLSGMSNKFELVVPIKLGRYDFEKEEFEVDAAFQIKGVRNIDFNMNDHNHNVTCKKAGEIKDYPRNMIVMLNRPVVLEKIPVKKEVAEFYLEEKKREQEGMIVDQRVHKSSRGAFFRLKVDITQYKNTVRAGNGSMRAVVFGRLEGYEIYADSAKTKPLYIYSVKDREAKRRLRRKKTDTAEEPAAETDENSKDALEGSLQENDQEEPGNEVQ